MREFWRGSAEAWECDEMGHMNVRYWVTRSLDCIVTLAELIGCGGAFALGATATLIPVRQHIKFMREARAGAPLFARGGITSVSESELTFYCEIVHSFTGEIGATFITTLAHADAKTARVFPFPARVKMLSEALLVEIPAHAQPRSIGLDHAIPSLTPNDALVAGYSSLGLAGVRPVDVDPFNRLFGEGMIGRVSNAMPNLLGQWREEATAEMTEIDGIARTAGAAVLEYRLDYLSWPQMGDQTAVYSGLIEVGEKTIKLRHLVLDPLTGASWCVCEALAVTLDLQARKIVANPPRAKAQLEAMLVNTAP
jgi:acyl-CoA thioester hydrolase